MRAGFGVLFSRADVLVSVHALEARLGSQPKILVRPHDFDASDALRPTTPEPAEATGDESPPDEPIDLEDLTDASDVPHADPASRLMEGLGAEVVEERARD